MPIQTKKIQIINLNLFLNQRKYISTMGNLKIYNQKAFSIKK